MAWKMVNVALPAGYKLLSLKVKATILSVTTGTPEIYFSTTTAKFAICKRWRWRPVDWLFNSFAPLPATFIVVPVLWANESIKTSVLTSGCSRTLWRPHEYHVYDKEWTHTTVSGLKIWDAKKAIYKLPYLRFINLLFIPTSMTLIRRMDNSFVDSPVD